MQVKCHLDVTQRGKGEDKTGIKEEWHVSVGVEEKSTGKCEEKSRFVSLLALNASTH